MYITGKIRDTVLSKIRYDSHNTLKPHFLSDREF